MEIAGTVDRSKRLERQLSFPGASLSGVTKALSCLAVLLFVSLGAGPRCGAGEVSLAADINAGSGSSGLGWLTELDGVLYLTAYTPATGVELWRFDGKTVSLAADVCPGPDSSTPASLVAYNNRLYFSAEGPSGPPRLYQFDGASASLAPGYTPLQNPESLFVYDGKLYFRAAQFGTYGIELWTYDGTHQTVIDLYPGPGSSGPKEFIEFNGVMYFNANSQFWRYDGYGPAVVDPNINPEGFVVFKDKLYFRMVESLHGNELWRYDGVNPAVRVTDINPGPGYSSPYGMTVYRGALYFSADNGVDGFELWRYDGCKAEMVADINPTPYVPGIDPVHNSFPHDFTVYKGVLFFAADDGQHGNELWCYNRARLARVADLYPGPALSDPSGFKVFDDALYFSAYNEVVGTELWRMTPSLTLLSPNGGESLKAGSVHTIVWKDEPCVHNVAIEFSSDNGSTWTPVRSAHCGNTGSYRWIVPEVESYECLIRISDSDHSQITDESDSPFEVHRCTRTSDLAGDGLVDTENQSSGSELE